MKHPGETSLTQNNMTKQTMLIIYCLMQVFLCAEQH